VSVQVREMVHAFYGSSYATCLQQLEALRPQLALDMHLAVSHQLDVRSPPTRYLQAPCMEHLRQELHYGLWCATAQW
jgi:hypothetical protein